MGEKIYSKPRGEQGAFPTEQNIPTAMSGSRFGPGVIQGGMTLREYLAGRAMQGILSHLTMGAESAEVVAVMAVEQADALLIELGRKAKQ